MNRLSRYIWTIVSSRALPPVVMGFFLVVYIGIAFFSDETLTVLLALTRGNIFLAAVLALLPLNCLCRIVVETHAYRKRRQALSGRAVANLPRLFDEVFDMPASPAFPELQRRLVALGYKTHISDRALHAWRGVNSFPARIIFLTATFCLFTGIFISTTARVVHRGYVVEGEPLPLASGGGGTVERIVLAKTSGAILAKTLTMEIASSIPGYGKRAFGLYPPTFYGGAFVYPRYLGLVLYLSFTAPDLNSRYEQDSILNVFPPGKEDSVAIPGSPYRIVFSIAEPGYGNDRYVSYMTGRMTLQFKLLKGNDLLLTGSAPSGGEFNGDGFRLAFPEVRRLVVTDFISDYGVFFIWAAAILFVAASGIWLPIRLFSPRREMLFSSEGEIIRACSRTEGRGRRHNGAFHEALDLLEEMKKQVAGPENSGNSVK